MPHMGFLERLGELKIQHAYFKEPFYRRSSDRRFGLLAHIQTVRHRFFDYLFDEVGTSRAFSRLVEGIRDYAARSDWALLDLVALAACADDSSTDLAATIAPRALLYHALRMLDDVLDGHSNYKGGNPTLLGELQGDAELRHAAVAGNLIPLIMMIVRIGPGLHADDRTLVERTLLGMLHECVCTAHASLDYYREVAREKMVAYGFLLYRAALEFFDSGIRSTLENFLARSFYISQIINDLQDREDDERRHQLNYWLLGLPPEVATAALLAEFTALSDTCGELDLRVREYGHARVADLAGYLVQVSRGAQAPNFVGNGSEPSDDCLRTLGAPVVAATLLPGSWPW